MVEMQSYLSIPVPISRNAKWYKSLASALHDYGISWQGGCFHITAAFINDELSEEAIQKVRLCLDSLMSAMEVQTICLDKLDAFTTRRGNQHIINITSTQPQQQLVNLVETLTKELKGYDITPFRMHITLGRVGVSNIDLKELQSKIAALQQPNFNIELTTAEYRRLNGEVVGHPWTFRNQQ